MRAYPTGYHNCMLFTCFNWRAYPAGYHDRILLRCSHYEYERDWELCSIDAGTDMSLSLFNNNYLSDVFSIVCGMFV